MEKQEHKIHEVDCIKIRATNKENGGTDGRVFYALRLFSNGQRSCECKGWRYRGTCKHMKEYGDQLGGNDG